MIARTDFRETGGYKAIRELCSLPEPPDAVLVANNLMTVGALEALRDEGLSVPGDVRVVGFDDAPWAKLLQPSLTVVAQPTYEIGRRSAELLLTRALAARTPTPRSAAASASHRSGEHMTATTTYRAATQEDIDFFRTHGYIVVRDVIDPAELDSITALCDQIIERKETLAFDWAWEKGKSRDEREFKILQSSPTMLWPDAVSGAPFRKWAVDFASALMGFELEFWYDQFLAKPPQKGAATLWHQDEGYWGRNLDDLGHHLLDAVPRRRRAQWVHALHRRRSARRRPPAPPARARAERSALLRARRVAGDRMPDLARQRDVPPLEDAAHDHGQLDRRMAQDPDAAPSQGRRSRRGRPLPVEGLREPDHRRAHDPTLPLKFLVFLTRRE